MEQFRHPNCNHVLNPAKGDKAGTTPLHTERCTVAGWMCTASYWQPNADDLRILREGGSVRLVVLGLSHPPLRLEVAAPVAVGVGHAG